MANTNQQVTAWDEYGNPVARAPEPPPQAWDEQGRRVDPATGAQLSPQEQAATAAGVSPAGLRPAFHQAAMRNIQAQPGITPQMRAASPINQRIETGLRYAPVVLGTLGTGAMAIDAAGTLADAIPTIVRGMAGETGGRTIGGTVGQWIGGPWGRRIGSAAGGWLGGRLGGGGGGEPEPEPPSPTTLEQSGALRTVSPPPEAALGQPPVSWKPPEFAEEEGALPTIEPRTRVLTEEELRTQARQAQGLEAETQALKPKARLQGMRYAGQQQQ